MPSPVTILKFLRLFERQGVTIEIKGSHVKMRKVIDGQTVHYVAVVHGKRVDTVYVKKARKAFRLLPKDGVSDGEFA